MKRNLIALVIVILIILVVLSVAQGLKRGGSFVSAPVPAQPFGSAADQPGPGPGCGGCVGIADNGRTIEVKETGRVTLDLPEAGYDKGSLSLAPADAFGETFGATAAPGDWVRTFQAVEPGTTTLRVPSRAVGYPDYVLTIVVDPIR